jgi:uncharacterized protein YbjQ (UPF0145 family)
MEVPIMIITTTERISDKEFDTLGIVKGSTIQSKNIGRDIMSGFKTIVGGELQSYTIMMNEARALATKRMVEDAESLGADAIVCMRYASSSVMTGAAEVMAYGTAVKFK